MSIEAPVAGERSLGDEMLYLFALTSNRYESRKAEFRGMMEKHPVLGVGCATVLIGLAAGVGLFLATPEGVK